MFLSNNNLVDKIFLALAFTAIISLSNANVFQQHEVNVTVKNALGPDLVVQAHCFSSEDDIGTHTLVNGQTFQWHFRPNIWGSTKYECHLESKFSNGDYLLYSFRRDDDFCGKECVYNITPEGICLEDELGSQRCTNY